MVNWWEIISPSLSMGPLSRIIAIQLWGLMVKQLNNTELDMRMLKSGIENVLHIKEMIHPIQTLR